MKSVILVLSLITASLSFAVEKKETRKPNSDGACATEAGAAAMGLVKGLGQDVTVSKVALIGSRKNQETYSVKLEGSGFSSAETNKPLTVKLYDLGDGCGLKSITLQP